MRKFIARGEKEGKPLEVVFIGLTHEELDILKDNYSLKVEAFLGFSNVEILVFAGETDQEVDNKLSEIQGVIVVSEPESRN